MLVTAIPILPTLRADRSRPTGGCGIDHAPATASTALVSVEPPQTSWAIAQRAPRPELPFVAQLMATSEQFPQTRTLRRASNDRAQAAYRGAVDAAGTNRATNSSLLRTI